MEDWFNENFYKKYINPNITEEEYNDILDILSKPVRNIEKNKKIMNYIKKHGVYITLTSSPMRLKKATTALSLILLNPYIKKIYVTLPKLYRNKEKYSEKTINFIKGMDKRIVIKRPKNDIGPITKMLPTLQSIKDKSAIVISIDDDVAYPPALINELIYHSVTYPKIIFTGSGFPWGDDRYPDSDIDRKKYWPVKRKPRYPCVDIVEGWGAIAYKKKLLDIPLMLKLSRLDISCKLSDDLIISYVLAKKNIKMKVIVNKYYNDQDDLYSFEYGLGDDALHKGGGLENNIENANIIKYKKCLEIIYNKI